ncbi:hypothetical protein [Kitasatospora sp. NPDC088134]|uniref:hypothetical protein n=1 Tax=Kitasatospora sp. NPDC088134 TaxID=3364071 RepID=UPI0038062C28
MAEVDPYGAVGGWIWSANVQAFLTLVGQYVGYDFDATDWQAVALGLEATDDERSNGWYCYPLAGVSCQVEVYLANATGGSEVSVRVLGASAPELRLQVSTLLDAFACGALRQDAQESRPTAG